MNPATVAPMVGGALRRQAEQILSSGPEELRAFEEALRSAESEAPAQPPAAAGETVGPPPVDDPTAADTAVPRDPAASTPGGGERLLEQVEAGHRRLAELLGEIDSGRGFSPRELLGLQTEMHQIVRQLETAGKILGEVVSGTKTLLQQQV